MSYTTGRLMSECHRCGGWIDLGINDVHGYCYRCEAWVGNVPRMHLCSPTTCLICGNGRMNSQMEDNNER